MTETDLPAEALADPRTFTDPAALNRLLARLRRSDPLAVIHAPDYDPVRLVTRHADIRTVERDPARFINAPRQAHFSNSQMQASRKALAETGGIAGVLRARASGMYSQSRMRGGASIMPRMKLTTFGVLMPARS